MDETSKERKNQFYDIFFAENPSFILSVAWNNLLQIYGVANPLTLSKQIATTISSAVIRRWPFKEIYLTI